MLSDQVFIDAWEQTKKFVHPADTQQTKFFDNSFTHKTFMEADLDASGLSSMHIDGTLPRMMSLPQSEAAYVIPYHDTAGQPIMDTTGRLVMYRAKLKQPPMSKLGKYTQPSLETLSKIGLPAVFPYIHPLTVRLSGETVICAEGEKKTVSVIRHLGIPAFGIGGCQMWRNPDGSGTIHPWIKRLLADRGCKEVIIVPDGDLFRYDICNAYGTFAHTLKQEGYNVKICNPAGKIDDLLKEWGPRAVDGFRAIPTVSIDDLVQSPSLLASRYNLAFRKNDKGVVTVHQTTSNVMKLMEDHPAFPKVWRNADDNRVYIGDTQAQPDLTEMEIANYFQHNLGFEKISHRVVYACVQAMAKRNQRSPMLEWIKGLSWDGSPRLENWMTKHWGVEDSVYLREVSSKWLVSACARMERPGTKIDWMLIVMSQKQGLGKTSMPALVFKQNSLTLYGEQNDKDLHMKLHSALVIGFDELDSFGKKESSFLKAMITTAQDHFRPPYGASVEVFDRRCILYGCGNRHEFLQSDPSGYRRYAVVEVKQKLDFAALEADLEQLWAEAWAVYSEGKCSYWEIENATAEAEKYVVPSELEEDIRDYVEKLKVNPTNCRGGFAYVKYSLMVKSLQVARPNPREVAAVLRKLGAEKKASRGPSGGAAVADWWLLPLDEASTADLLRS